MKYDEPGIYELTYKATDDCGNVGYATRNITVEGEPPSEYPYTIATIDAVSIEEGRPYEPPIIPTEYIHIKSTPKNTREYGSAVINNFIVDGVSLGDITVFVEASNRSKKIEHEIIIEVNDYLHGPCYIFYHNDLSIYNAYIDNEGETPTPAFSWDSVTITMEGVQ